MWLALWVGVGLVVALVVAYAVLRLVVRAQVQNMYANLLSPDHIRELANELGRLKTGAYAMVEAAFDEPPQIRIGRTSLGLRLMYSILPEQNDAWSHSLLIGSDRGLPDSVIRTFALMVVELLCVPIDTPTLQAVPGKYIFISFDLEKEGTVPFQKLAVTPPDDEDAQLLLGVCAVNINEVEWSTSTMPLPPELLAGWEGTSAAGLHSNQGG